MTLLNCDKKLYSKKLATKKSIAVAVVFATAALNVLLAVLRTDETHTLFLVINVVADVACGWFLIAWYYFAISTQSKLLKLETAGSERTQKIQGVVTDISEHTQVDAKLPCRKITVAGDETRVLFAVDGCGITFKYGEKYNITTVENIAIFAEVLQ